LPKAPELIPQLACKISKKKSANIALMTTHEKQSMPSYIKVYVQYKVTLCSSKGGLTSKVPSRGKYVLKIRPEHFYA
jgi:hypothetical protein